MPFAATAWLVCRHGPRPRARGEVRARGRAVRLATPSVLPELAKRNLRPRALRFGWGFLDSVPDCRAVLSNSESGCRAASGGCPLCLGPSHKKTSSMVTNLVAFPLGFWMRAPRAPWSYETGVPYGRHLRTSRRVGERAARSNAETTLPLGATQVLDDRQSNHWTEPSDRPKAATVRTSYVYHPRGLSQLHVQFPCASAAIRRAIQAKA